MTTALEDPRWLALSEERRRTLLEENRDYDVEDGLEWWDCIEEMLKEDCMEKGIYVEEMYFSGFWSQGDGASFKGWVDDWAKLLTHLGKPKYVPHAADEGWRLSCTSRGNYSHSGCMSFEEQVNAPDNPYDEDTQPLQHSAFELTTISAADVEEVSTNVVDFFKKLADELYCDLEKEYDYLTSDEHVVERLLDRMDDDELRGEEDEDDETEDSNQMEFDFA